MPGAMRKMGVYLGLVEDEEYGDGEGYPGRREEYAEARHPREHGGSRHTDVDRPGSGEYAEDFNGYAHGYPEDRPAYQITTLHPRTYNEARTIGEQFRRATPVIMNLSEMDDADAKRLVDFAAGLTFGLHGRIERVTAKVFLLSPHNVTVTAQDKARIVETGFFNQS
ncbi:MAG: cell division protein SepF [Jatrophihabitantaceae bacterium]